MPQVILLARALQAIGRGLSVVLVFAVWLSGETTRADLNQLLQEALTANPEIVAAQKRYEASRQRPTQASSLPDPMFSPGYNSNGRPWPGAGLGTEPSSQIGFMVSQEFPFPGKRKLAGDMAAKESEVEWQDYEQVRLDVVSRVKQAYYRLAYAFSAVDVLDRNLALLGTFLRITEVRYSVGKAAQQDVFKAQTQISILETKKVQLEREKRAREAEINSLVNRRPGSPVSRPAPLEPRPLAAALDELYAAARQNSPLLQRDEKMIQRAEVAVNLARRQYYPDFTLNGGYYNMGSMPAMYMFRADFKIPLYFFRKQRAAITEQSQALIGSRKTYESTNQALHFRIQDAYLLGQTAGQLVRLYGQTVIPQANLALESSLASYETGAVDFLTVFTNYITVVEYEMNYHEELRNFYLALTSLEEMTAKPLTN